LRWRLFSDCLARLVACAEFAKGLLLPGFVRKTAYHPDFGRLCQSRPAASGPLPMLIGQQGCIARTLLISFCFLSVLYAPAMHSSDHSTRLNGPTPEQARA
jgi:hypothetical protein